MKDQDTLGTGASCGALDRPQLATGEPGQGHQATVVAGDAGVGTLDHLRPVAVPLRIAERGPSRIGSGRRR